MKVPLCNSKQVEQKVLCFFVALLLLSNYSCKTNKNTTLPSTLNPLAEINLSPLDTVFTEAPYQASNKRINDILHTKLELSFDLKNKQLLGIATLTMKPYFLPASSLQLNAKGFEIKEIAMLSGNIKTKLKYIYDNKILTIDLGRTFKRTENYTIYIDYIARPESLEKYGYESTELGLYFINADGSIPHKRTQIYTQGETEGSSCWFPTIDSPNEKFTQEISITVPKKFLTLSNGLLVWQQLNSDSTRTDTWKQNLPHSPYLTFMCVGQYAVAKDVYKDKEISYYVYPEYEKYAKDIFGKTPEMMEYFSKILGTEYPWEKYSQVFVQDYFSGAMENTSASLFGDFAQKTSRELLDDNDEDFIAHELFHQWFGNLVTCESWANTTLNEGFATYGEYLWFEYKYGKQKADEHLYQDLQEYFAEAENAPKELIRYTYLSKEDMFDSHSYQKGGLVLHMLRSYVGDEVFFAALHLYLEKNKFSNTEFHQLRLAFEEVSGEDLNWFFNQWFLKAGHPNISVSYLYNDTSKSLTLNVFQENAEKNNLYKIPIAIDIYVKGKKERMNVVIEKQKETYTFSVPQTPDWVNFDAEKILIAEVRQKKSVAEWIYQYNKSMLFADKMQALINLNTYIELPVVQELFLKAMNDAFPEIKKYAIKQSGILVKYTDTKLKQVLIKLVQKDENSQVRAEAIVALGENYISNDLLNVYKKSLEDKSYLVQSKTLQNIYYYDKELGMDFSKSFEKDSSIAIITALAQIYAESGTANENNFFVANANRFKDGDKYTFAKQYSKFLLNKNDSVINNGLLLLEDVATQDKLWYIRLAGFNGINVLKNMYNNKQKDAIAKIDLLNKTKPNSPQIQQLQGVLSQTERQLSRISSIISSIKTTEKNSNLIEIYRSN